ncbi:hypothetical protein ACIQWR_37530 [Streptomyces sp. NPDC098789]|uniref:hypothetical protein n=1 Tax=Streptomyces sp. NPDC098789 TaxID=3366098 RepID=UPI00380285B5
MYVNGGPVGFGMLPSAAHHFVSALGGPTVPEPAHPAPQRPYTDGHTPLYQMLVHEWQYLGRCSPECCRPGMAQIHHLSAPARW